MAYLDSFPRWLEVHSWVVCEDDFFYGVTYTVDSRIVSSIVVGEFIMSGLLCGGDHYKSYVPLSQICIVASRILKNPDSLMVFAS